MLRFAAIAGALTLTAAAPQATMLQPGTHTYVTQDGLKLWYRVAGSAAGIPVIYLHGGPGEGSQGFARTIGPELERNLRMVYLDQRGAGHSDKPADADRYTLKRIVDDVEQLRLKLGVRRIALIGHSYGGMIALDYAARYPGHVQRMVLVDTTPDFPAAVEQECARLKTEDGAAYARAVAISQPGYPSCIPFEAYKGQQAGAYMMRMLGTRPGTMAKLDAADKAETVDLKSPSRPPLADAMFSYRFRAFNRLTMPVMILTGERDRLAQPAEAQNFARSFPHARAVTYRDAGHFSFVDAPTDFARDVTRFLQER